MNQILKVQSVGDYSSFVGHVDTHQFVAVIDYAEVSPILHTKSEFSVYALFLLDDTLEDLTYGHSGYGYEKVRWCVSLRGKQEVWIITGNGSTVGDGHCCFIPTCYKALHWDIP